MREDDFAVALAADLDGTFERMVRAYQARLYGFALRQTCGNAQDAEEIAQDAFVRAYRALRTYPPERVRALAVRPWLYQITLNVARNRRRGRRLRLVPLDAGEDGATSDGHQAPAAREEEQPDLIAERTEGAAELATLVTALPDRYRAAVVLRHIEGLSYGEAAHVLGQPIGTVKANVHRGVRLLRASLIESKADGRTVAAVGSTHENDEGTR
jgi:RNA polymerase sigma-70 factor (ECF subfamily)